jgi:hypothetical protein
VTLQRRPAALHLRDLVHEQVHVEGVDDLAELAQPEVVEKPRVLARISE